MSGLARAAHHDLDSVPPGDDKVRGQGCGGDFDVGAAKDVDGPNGLKLPTSVSGIGIMTVSCLFACNEGVRSNCNDTSSTPSASTQRADFCASPLPPSAFSDDGELHVSFRVLAVRNASDARMLRKEIEPRPFETKEDAINAA